MWMDGWMDAYEIGALEDVSSRHDLHHLVVLVFDRRQTCTGRTVSACTTEWWT